MWWRWRSLTTASASAQSAARAWASPRCQNARLSWAGTGEEAVVRAANLQPDVVLMDLQMPKVNGIEATRRILQESPSVRTLVVTLFEDDDSVFMALRAGARGYVLKDADEEEMVHAFRKMGKGEAIFSPDVATRALVFLAFATPKGASPQVSPTLTGRERV